jgi:hypothetical protein
MDKVYLEYEQCRCSKFEKEVTITSMVIEDPNPDATPRVSVKQAFDCDQKISCGVLTMLGKSRRLNWADCTHPNLAEVSASGGE